MITTVFADTTDGKYTEVASYPYNVQCLVGEYVDFTDFTPFGDDDIFEVTNIIHLPNEAKKIVELRRTHTVNIVRPKMQRGRTFD